LKPCANTISTKNCSRKRRSVPIHHDCPLYLKSNVLCAFLQPLDVVMGPTPPMFLARHYSEWIHILPLSRFHLYRKDWIIRYRCLTVCEILKSSSGQAQTRSSPGLKTIEQQLRGKPPYLHKIPSYCLTSSETLISYDPICTVRLRKEIYNQFSFSQDKAILI